MIRKIQIFSLFLLVASGGVANSQALSTGDAQPGRSVTTQIPEVLTRDKEMQLALSAAPQHLRDGAAVYVLEKNGFIKARESSNGFTCIVNRDHPLNLKPTCYDAEGTATILPTVMRVGELLMLGKPIDDINKEIEAGFRSGKYSSPRRAGVAYMLSGDIRNFNPSTGKTDSFPPHMMFYAPNITNRDIGTTPQALGKDPWLPFVAYEGPQGYIIVLVGDNAKHPAH